MESSFFSINIPDLKQRWTAAKCPYCDRSVILSDLRQAYFREVKLEHAMCEQCYNQFQDDMDNDAEVYNAVLSRFDHFCRMRSKNPDYYKGDQFDRIRTGIPRWLFGARKQSNPEWAKDTDKEAQSEQRSAE